MTFNSFLFFLFFPIVVSVYFVMPHKWRWVWLLLSSCYFYMAFIPAYILILFLLILIDYIAAIGIEKTQGYRRKIILLASIFSTCLVLFVFKYFDFINASAAFFAHYLGVNYPIKNISLILPLGLSFHTFQSLGYVIDVYRGKQKVQRHLGIYALYVMFFPQLVAGPIERSGHMMSQFFENHPFDAVRVKNGLKRMLWGLFQKVVIADRLAIVVNHVYDKPSNFGSASLIVATIFFAFQIYCDFCGYSDIAIGAAEVLGFDLVKNFARPYLAVSIADFWHRWHISLSTWFRDYLYIPLGGNHARLWRWRFNIMLTFLISGLWHGANWTFVVWGAMHGFYYLFSKWTEGFRQKMTSVIGLAQRPQAHQFLKIVSTFALVTFAWIFFRANTLADAGYIVSHLFNCWTQPLSFGAEADNALGLNLGEFIFAISLIVFLLWVNIVEQKQDIRVLLAKNPPALRWAVYVLFVLVVMNLGVTAAIPFIYFQF